MLIEDFGSLEPSFYLVKQKTWRLGEVWSCEAFPFPCPTEMGHSQIWRPLLDYKWKTEGNNAPLEVF